MFIKVQFCVVDFLNTVWLIKCNEKNVMQYALHQ